MKHAHLIDHKVRLAGVPETLSYLKGTEGELVTIHGLGYIAGPGITKPYAVLACGSTDDRGRRGLHMNISLDNEDEWSLEDISSTQ